MRSSVCISERRSPARSRTGNSRNEDIRGAVLRLEEVVASINGQLATLIRQSTKKQLGSPHLSVAEAAVYLGVKPDTLKRKMQRGEVPFHRRSGTAPYFLKQEIDKWLADPETLCVSRERALSREEPSDTKNREGPLSDRKIEQLLRERATLPGKGTDENRPMGASGRKSWS